MFAVTSMASPVAIICSASARPTRKEKELPLRPARYAILRPFLAVRKKIWTGAAVLVIRESCHGCLDTAILCGQVHPVGCIDRCLDVHTGEPAENTCGCLDTGPYLFHVKIRTPP